jgi:hypothetical protein
MPSEYHDDRAVNGLFRSGLFSSVNELRLQNGVQSGRTPLSQSSCVIRDPVFMLIAYEAWDPRQQLTSEFP